MILDKKTKAELIGINQALSHEIELLKFEIEQLRRAIYGRKSERFEGIEPTAENENQTTLFEKEETGKQVKSEKEKPQKKSKSKNKPKRQKLPESLPVQTQIIEPEVDTSEMRKIGEQITEKLAIKPAELYMIRIIRPKYIDDEGKIHIGQYDDPFPKFNADVSLAAHVAVGKYIDHQPLYRQSKIFKRQNINLSRSTLNGMVSKGAQLLEPLYDELVKHTMNGDYLQADESSIPVLTKDKPGSTMKGCLLAKVAPKKKLVVFDYIKTKEKPNILASLNGFKGYLQVDGNVSYEQKGRESDVELMHCLVHSRRKFEQALDYDREKSSHALNQIKQLYLIERQILEQELDEEQTVKMRKKHSVPILGELKKWLEKNNQPSLPSNPIQTAIRYMLRRWEGLVKYTTHGMLRPDNNLIENQIRPLALGRKNYLFAGAHSGAEYAAIFYSFFGTCKLNGIQPQKWLMDVYNRINEHPVNKLIELLPTENYQFSKDDQ